jgi:hypothetical protein
MTNRRSSSGSRGAPPESPKSWDEEFNRTWLKDICPVAEEMVVSRQAWSPAPSGSPARARPRVTNPPEVCPEQSPA